MSTALQIDGDVDTLVQVIADDAHIHNASSVDDLAYNIHLLNRDYQASAFVETTEEEVIVTIKIPRN